MGTGRRARTSASRASGRSARLDNLQAGQHHADMDTLRQDLRNAFYAMRRSPGFAASAILTLAVSIGGATAVFSVTCTAC